LTGADDAAFEADGDMDAGLKFEHFDRSVVLVWKPATTMPKFNYKIFLKRGALFVLKCKPIGLFPNK
jgi:hypothetical protein